MNGWVWHLPTMRHLLFAMFRVGDRWRSTGRQHIHPVHRWPRDASHTRYPGKLTPAATIYRTIAAVSFRVVVLIAFRDSNAVLGNYFFAAGNLTMRWIGSSFIAWGRKKGHSTFSCQMVLSMAEAGHGGVAEADSQMS